MRFLGLGLVAALGLLQAGAGGAQELFNAGSIRGYDWTGFYGQAGFAVGEIEFDDTDSDASGGVTLSGGYRIFPWLSADGNFTYMGGGDVEINGNDLGEGSFFAFTFGPKVYPLGAFAPDAIPHFIQPYGLIGIGGGQFDIEDSNFDDESSFIARFILGIDLWATDQFGFFIEGGGHAASENDVDGVGVFSMGGQFRF